MKILSLFDGISCARVALERAGIPVELYLASEIDKYAIDISSRNYPDIIHVGDVTKLDCMPSPFPMAWSLTPIDLLIGGSPCQDLSIAKKNRKGLDGERSGLFWEYVRILKEVKPKYFILENVNSMPKEAKELITKTLGVEPIMINAALVSAQNRKRLFWVGKRIGLTVLEGQPYYEKVEIPQPKDKGILLKDILEDGVGVQLTERRTEEAKKMRSEYRKKYGSDYSPRRAKELVPRSDGKANTLTTMATKESLVYVGHINKTNGQANRVYSIEGKSVALSAMSGGLGAKTGMYLIEENIRILTPIECERLQGLPDNYTEGISPNQRRKVCGNAFNVDVVAHILSNLASN
jgi:DNA (cytosine-5)-methyltransferase 3A